ncbi:MAG: putative metalloprotease CJM1_0395 family protein [Pseudomonadota bacterium]
MNIHSSSNYTSPFFSASEGAKPFAVGATLASDNSVKTISSEHSSSVLKPLQQAKEGAKTTTDAQATQAQSAQEKLSEPPTSREDNQKNRAEQRQEQIEQQQIQQLSARDREVRNHEQAHAAAGGQYAGAPRYQYERGPDGVNYAVAGEVSISTSPVSGDPQATIQKAQVIRRAALAPAEPSPQDRAVAAEATQMEAQARVALAEQQRQQRLPESEQNTDEVEQTSATASVAAANTSSSADDKDKVKDNDKDTGDGEISNINELINQTNQRLIKSASGSEVSGLGQLFSGFA